MRCQAYIALCHEHWTYPMFITVYGSQKWNISPVVKMNDFRELRQHGRQRRAVMVVPHKLMVPAYLFILLDRNISIYISRHEFSNGFIYPIVCRLVDANWISIHRYRTQPSNQWSENYILNVLSRRSNTCIVQSPIWNDCIIIQYKYAPKI